MFSPLKSDNGHVLPWEYMTAAAGTYRAGQMLKVSATGQLAAVTAYTATPPYLCMADATAGDGDILPVTRVSRDAIYETELAADDATAVVGGKLKIAAGGLAVEAGAGTFEIVSLDGTSAGDAVRGRWS